MKRVICKQKASKTTSYTNLLKLNKKQGSTVLIILSFSTFFLVSCGNDNNNEEKSAIEKHVEETKKTFAPDKRVALFDITVNQSKNTYLLKGESNLPEAVKSLKSRLDNERLSYIDSIIVLPDSTIKEKKGIIKISVANLRAKPSHSSEMITQATLGTTIAILKEENSWYYIQTPDHYLGWVDKGGIVSKTDSSFSEWKNSKKIIYTAMFGTSHIKPDTKANPVSDLVAGNILEYIADTLDFYQVKYPDQKTAYIQKTEAKQYKNWLQSLHADSTSLVNTAKKMMGLPYLWGGTSTKGVDCSGYVKTVYYLNGIVLPRDASQQIHTGILIDDTKNFQQLNPGDLLFFGSPADNDKPERVIHVGMWIGNNKFIHSMGDVHISNFDKNAPDFDEYNYNRYLRTKRVISPEGLTFIDKEDHVIITVDNNN